LLFAGVRFGRSDPRASSVLGPKRVSARSRTGWSPARRRLTTSWMLTLRAPSFHVGAGRAFTSFVRSSDASRRRPAPDRRLHLRRPAGAPCVSLERAKSPVTDRPESSHRPLALRSHLLFREKMEERLEAPSVVSNPLPASADLRGVSAAHTRRLAAPDRVIHHAVPVTFWRDACAPFRSDTGCYPASLRLPHTPRGARLHRPRGPPRFRGERLRSASADRAVCDGLARPPASCLATVHGARARCFRPTSASHCFSTRALAPVSLPASLRGLRLAPSREGLAPSPTEAGGPGVSRRPIRFDGRLRVGARRFLPRTPSATESLAPLSPSHGAVSLVARRHSDRVGRDRARRRSVKEPPTRRSEAPFIAGFPRACAGRTQSRKRSREVSVSRRVPVSIHPPRACSRKRARRARRPSPNASRSGEMEGIRFSAPATVRRLLQRLQDARARPRASDPRPLGGRAFPPVTDAFAPAPHASLSSDVACEGPPPSEGGRAASHTRPFGAVSRPCKTGERWSDDGHRSSRRRVRSGAANPPSVAPRVGEAMAWLRVWADPIGAKVLRHPLGLSP